MIEVRLSRSSNGMLKSVTAEGHAGYARKGFDIVCSAVTVILRTTLQVLENTSGIELKSENPERGFLSFDVNVKEPGSETEQKLVYAGEFLEAGIGSLNREYPDYVNLLIKTV